MNYNQNNPPRQGGFGKKVKRVSDVAALGMSPPAQNYPQAPFDPTYNTNMNQNQPPFNENSYDPQGFESNMNFNQYNVSEEQASPMSIPSPFIPNKSQFGMMLQQPMVQGMAVEFGQQLASQGKDIVNKKIEKYVSVSELKYYFAVDTKYVLKKLLLIFFPFTHKDWTVKYDQEHPVQPRYEINAPDLYIPTMAYVTYVVLAGFVLGMQHKFSPEQIGIQASSALAYSIFELFIYAATKYLTNIQTRLGVYDLLSFSGYKYAIIIASILMSVIFKSFGYYLCLGYCSIALSFFMMRTLKVQILADPSIQHGYTQDTYGQPRHTGGAKRKRYFIFLIALMQPFLSWWLSYHLVPTKSIVESNF
ncbi:yip1d-interacting factor 1 [Arctopsyche grandis]|uniref:yip1d-interacting factor 1 n=1 Tax=Arctopsyche grandis TaxID=121162 RepID=UPI00406D72ED